MRSALNFPKAILISINICLLCSTFSSSCFGAPYELTVYSDDFPDYEKTELELTFSIAEPRPEIDAPKGKVLQGLAEYSYGVAPGWLIGFELPGVRAEGSSRFEGIKGEAQFVAPHEDIGWYWGMRCDIGYESSVYVPHGGNGTDINPIIGYHWSSWHLVANPSIQIPFGGESKKVEFMPAAKLMKKVDSTDVISVEYFGNSGPVSRLLPYSKGDEMVYLVWSKKLDRKSIDLGLGQPLNASPGNADRRVIKIAMNFEIN